MVRDAIRKLEIEDGDVVLVKHGTPLSQKDNFHSFARTLGRTGRERCIVVVVDEFDDLTVLDPVGMLQHGWVREEGEEDA